MNQPTPEQLAALALGDQVDPTLAAKAGEPAVAAEVARLSAILNVMKNDDTCVPPVEVVRALRERLRQGSVVESWLQSLRKVVLELVFDSRRQMGVMGFRGGALGGESTVTLAYSVSEGEELSVDLQIEPAGGAPGGSAPHAWKIRGQIDPVPGGAPAAEVMLVENESEVVIASAVSEGGGRFDLRCMGSTPRHCTLYVRSGEVVVCMRDVKLP